MKKSLKELKKEDWNRLFPIELVDHNPEWKNIYKKEKQRILDKVGKKYCELSILGAHLLIQSNQNLILI